MTDALDIAVVDDDPATLHLVTGVLRHKGHTVRSFENSPAALEAMVSAPPRVAVVDLHMPDMDGVELCRQLQERLGTRAPAVVVLSATDDGELLARGMDAPGSMLLLRKPFRSPELLATVARAANLAGPQKKVLGGWELLEEVGRGGMGVVHRGRPIGGGEDVAVKVLDSAVILDEDVATLKKELLLLCTLHHPNIVRLHAAGVEKGVPYYVMDIIRGPTLQQAVQQRPWSYAQAAPVLSQVAQAVAYLHGRGVIHRDLKSSNILLEGDGVKLVDFGTAQLLSSLRRDTQVFLGTPAYMAPEMITGETNHPSVDVFALGVLAYRVLTLEWPVNPEVRDATHWSQAYARHTIPRLDSKVSVPVDVADLVTRMLSPRAVERPDAAAVVQAFSAG